MQLNALSRPNIAPAKHCWVIELGEFKSDKKIICQINCGILKASKNNRNSSKALVPIVGEDLLRAFYRLFYLQFCDSSDQWKDTAQQFERYFYMKINYNFYSFSYKFVFIFFLSFLTNQKQKSGFQPVGRLVTRNISVYL